MNQLKIFVVDDDIYSLNIFKQYLYILGNENVALFDSGISCLNQLSEKPDIIFLNYQMDTLSGYEVLDRIKRFDPNMYVVMISAKDGIKTANDSLKLGAFDYLQKGDDELVKIEKVLKKIVEVKDRHKLDKLVSANSIFNFHE